MAAQHMRPSRTDGSPTLLATTELLANRTGNRLLDQLSAEAFDQLKVHLSIGVLPLGQRLWEAGRAVAHVYFPERGAISVLVTMQDGATVEVGMIGCEGMLGVPIALGDHVAPRDARVLQSGSAIQMSAPALRAEMEKSPQLRATLLRYTRAYLSSATQLVACNQTHVLEQRLAAWLLRARARARQDQLVVTHEIISNALGVRRAGITVAAQSLQLAGFIQYSHGRVTIVDPEALEAEACECHAVIEGEYSRLLGETSQGALYPER